MKSRVWITIIILLILGFILSIALSKPAAPTPAVPTSSVASGEAAPLPGSPAISGVTDNHEQYPDGQIPRFEKFEITFSVNTAALNLQWPYDPAPPSGVDPRAGISVDAILTSPTGQVFTQPAFFYQDYRFQPDLNGSGQDWIYPSGSASWEVRFAPDEVGSWRYHLTVQDAGGQFSTPSGTFVVVTSPNHGFVRVSPDPRYFQFEDGTYFPGLGYNMNFDHISWSSPVSGNADNFRIMGQNGIQLVRMWLSEWSIFGAAWNPWRWIGANPDWHYLDTAVSYGNHGVSLQLTQADDACISEGHWLSAPIAVKPHTRYRVRVRVMTKNLSGPRIAGQPFGFVAKIPLNADSWLWGPGKNCNDPGVGQVVTDRLAVDSDWTEVTGTYTSGNESFLPAFYLALENVDGGSLAFVDHVWMEEDLSGGSYGPNILVKPGMDHQNYFDQRSSYAFDRVVELAQRNGVYLRPVVMEKNDWILNRIGYSGNFVTDSQAGNDNFYGDWRNMTRVRWLQQAWWRYLQARWGYATIIHSWELLNEGDPYNGLHYTLADEFGKYMHQFKPDDHLVSTSNWTSFPRTGFWASPAYPNLDFADVHTYIDESNQLRIRVDDDEVLVDNSNTIADTAAVTQKISSLLGAKGRYGAGKPIIRGEIGFVDQQGSETESFAADKKGVWLHNFIWGGINAGGLLESYWYEEPHIYGSGFDHRNEFGAYYRFIKDIPLNNGHYEDAQAEVSTAALRAWGQKDLTTGQAHLWIQNVGHTWQAMAVGEVIAPVSGLVILSGFAPGESFKAQWWDTYLGTIDREQMIRADGQGTIELTIAGLTSDLGVKILPAAP
jgi:hypothetical protein